MGGVGPVIVGGLYWKRGTTLAAWIAMIYGSVTSVGFIILQQVYTHRTGDTFPVNAFYVVFAIGWTAVLIYVVVSLLGKKKEFNLMRMLHRGKYAREDDPSGAPVAVRGLKLIGYTSDLPFTDKLTYWITGSWFFGWFTLFIVLVFCQNIFGISDDGWAKIWQYYFWMTLVITIGVSIWFFIGGMRDVKNLFAGLRDMTRNDADDGMVIGHHSRDDEPILKEIEETSPDES